MIDNDRLATASWASWRAPGSRSCARALPDPHRLLQGTGRYMRHVKLRPGRLPASDALGALIDAAYHDVRDRLAVSGA